MTTTPPEAEARSGERIAKLLARAGIASRREVERMIAEGRVKLGEDVITTPNTVLPNLKGVSVDGKPVKAAEPARLFVFHKPSGLITAERDPAGRPTIYTALRNALPPGTPRVMPIGRLDFNTEGLLLLTNDGELKRAMELPSTGIPRTYRARTYGDITQDQLEELSEGVTIDGMHYGSINANMERRTGRNQWVEVTITEGKNREVRRVLEYLGLEVSRLLRTSYGPFELLDLPRGAAVEIRQVDVEKFRKGLKGGKGFAPAEPGMEPDRPRTVAPPPPRETARPDAPKPARPAYARTARPTGERPAGERPARDTADKPWRSDAERPARQGADRPFRADGDRRARPAGDKPYGIDRDRPARPTGGKPYGGGGDRPARPAGGKPYATDGDRPARPSGKPYGSPGDRPARPAGGKPYGGGKPYASDGDRPARPGADNRYNAGGGRSGRQGSDRPGGRGPRSDGPRNDGRNDGPRNDGPGNGPNRRGPGRKGPRP